MKRQTNFKLWVLLAGLSGLLLVPALGQAAKEEGWGAHREWKAKLAQELKLSPEKEKQFTAVADQHAGSRKEIYEGLKKDQGQLQTAMAAAKPDEAKVKELVKAITDAQDKLLSSYKSERDAEMALLSPMEQGRYLTILHKWRQQMYEKHGMEPKMEQKKK
jgi:Spy/CpxP family protein refolding chaperone